MREFDGTFDRQEATAQRNAQISREEDARVVKAKADSERRTRRNNAVMQLREYKRAGVKPPSVDENGYPTASLALLLDLGWTIADVAGEKVLANQNRRPVEW